MITDGDNVQLFANPTHLGHHKKIPILKREISETGYLYVAIKMTKILNMNFIEQDFGGQFRAKK